MTPLEVALYAFAGGLCAFTLISLICLAFVAVWIRRAPLFDEDAYFADHIVNYSQPEKP